MPLAGAFDSPNCGAEYQLVRMEAPSASADEQITCRKCGAPLNGREGRFILKYFLVGDGRKRRALGRRRR